MPETNAPPRFCRSPACRKPVVWITMRSGKPMPVDPQEVVGWLTLDKPPMEALRRHAYVTKDGQMVVGYPSTEGAPLAFAVIGFTPHWSTCIDREKFKRGGELR